MVATTQCRLRSTWKKNTKSFECLPAELCVSYGDVIWSAPGAGDCVDSVIALLVSPVSSEYAALLNPSPRHRQQAMAIRIPRFVLVFISMSLDVFGYSDHRNKYSQYLKINVRCYYRSRRAIVVLICVKDAVNPDQVPGSHCLLNHGAGSVARTSNVAPDPGRNLPGSPGHRAYF